MRQILYIVNPISGRKNKGALTKLIEKSMQDAGIAYSIMPSVASGDYGFLREKIEGEKVTDIVIAGGDGTINQALSYLRKWPVRFGIIPCGSGNGLAFSAGIPKDPKLALDIILKGNEQQTDAFLINDRFACMLCGFGFDAQVAHDFANDPKRGLATYIRKTVANFFTAKAYPFELTVNGEKLKTEAFFISIANSNQFGNNFKIAPKASLTDGLLDIVIMSKQNKLTLLLNTALQVSGLNSLQQSAISDKAGIAYFQVEELTIKNRSNAPLHIDGDPVETMKEIEVKVLKGCFRLMVG